MPLYDVHSYIPVRVKVTGVEAKSHEAAIAAVESDHALQGEISRLISRDRPDDRIAAIETDEGPAVGYLVDVVGDEEYEGTQIYDVDSKGRMTQVGREPGAAINVSNLHRLALSSKAITPLLNKSRDQRDLMRRLDAEHENTVEEFIAKLLLGLTNRDAEEALARISKAAAALAQAEHFIERQIAVPSAFDAPAFAHHDAESDKIPVIVGGTTVGHIVQPHTKSDQGRSFGLWRNARYIVEDAVLAVGLPAIMAYFRESYDVNLSLNIWLHPGYSAIYGAEGTPRARILVAPDGTAQLRIFEPHESKSFPRFIDAFLYALGQAR